MKRNNNPRLFLAQLLLLLVGAAAVAAAAASAASASVSAAWSSSRRKLAAAADSASTSSTSSRHSNKSNNNTPSPPTTTTYPPSHTLTIAKRATVSIAEYARDPDAGPWRPNAASAARRRGGNSSRRRADEARRRRSPQSSPSDAELLASIPAWAREQKAENDLAAGDDSINNNNSSNDQATTSLSSSSSSSAARHGKNNNNGPPKVRAFDAIDAFQSTYAMDTGASFEPPDSAIAVGNGLALVAINSVLTFYRADDGKAVSAPILARDLLAVGYPDQDPYLLDPSVAYDPEVGRWYYTAARLDTDSQGSFTGRSALQVAVSASADPFDAGGWNIYTIPSSNTGGDDGSLAIAACVEAGSCLSDYGQMRVSGDGFWLAANVVTFLAGGGGGKKNGDGGGNNNKEFRRGDAIRSSSSSSMNNSTSNNKKGQDKSGRGKGGGGLSADGEEGDHIGASVYALSKFALAEGRDEIAVAQWYLDSLPQDAGEPAYTLMPALVADPWSMTSAAAGAAAGGAVVAPASATTTTTSNNNKTPNNNSHNHNANAHFMSTPYSRARDFLLHYLLTGARALRDPAVSADALQAALALRVSRVAVPNPWPLPPLDSRDVWQPQQGDFPLGQSQGEPAPGMIGGPDSKIAGLALARGRLVAVYQVLKTQSRRNGGGSGSSLLVTAAAWAQIDVGGGGKHGSKNHHGHGGSGGGSSPLTPRTEAYGVIDMRGADVIYPNVALLPSGEGGIGAVLTGNTTKPSAVVFPFSLARGGPGRARVSGPGVGLQDGASQYSVPARPRFGDYSGSTVEYGLWEGGGGGGGGGGGRAPSGKKASSSSSSSSSPSPSSSPSSSAAAVWFSSEYIGQSCTLAEYKGSEGDCPPYTCGCTRAELANFGTRVTRLGS